MIIKTGVAVVASLISSSRRPRKVVEVKSEAGAVCGGAGVRDAQSWLRLWPGTLPGEVENGDGVLFSKGVKLHRGFDFLSLRLPALFDLRTTTNLPPYLYSVQ